MGNSWSLVGSTFKSIVDTEAESAKLKARPLPGMEPGIFPFFFIIISFITGIMSHCSALDREMIITIDASSTTHACVCA